MLPPSLRHPFAERYTPPFRHQMPGTMRQFHANERPIERTIANLRIVRRLLYLAFTGQLFLLRDSIPPAPARLLWMNPASTSLGDSLLELSGRALLSAYALDLMTDRKNADLYRTDPYFGNVFLTTDRACSASYDFVLLDLFSTRSIRLKRRMCRKLPFATLQAFFRGPAFNPMLFSFFRVHHLLGYPHTEETLRSFLCPRLFVKNEISPLPAGDRYHRIALALGGVDPIRTYHRWHEVLLHLRRCWPPSQPFPEFVLVGSGNGLSFVQAVTTALQGCDVIALVGKLSLRATARAISDCRIFVGADGALMHCAVALGVPGVALFGRIQPGLRLPPATTMQALFDAQDVNNIQPESVAQTVQQSWKANVIGDGQPLIG